MIILFISLQKKDMMDTVKNRRTIRKYQQKDITPDLLNDLLETSFRASMTARCTPCCYPVAEPVAGENPITAGFSPL